jgi:hypothetical protein
MRPRGWLTGHLQIVYNLQVPSRTSESEGLNRVQRSQLEQTGREVLGQKPYRFPYHRRCLPDEI